jgi:hypothetical protein
VGSEALSVHHGLCGRGPREGQEAAVDGLGIPIQLAPGDRHFKPSDKYKQYKQGRHTAS